MELGIYKVYVRFYADNLPHYTNKKFSLSLEGKTDKEWFINAHKVIYRFIDHGNKIRAAFIVRNGNSDRLFDTLQVVNGKTQYVFTPDNPKHK